MGKNSEDFLNERDWETQEEIEKALENPFDAAPEKINHIEQLLRTSLYDPEQREEITREILGYIDQERAEELIEQLYKNQVDPITAGLNYSQSDIARKLNREI